jgi:IS1 family transposase
MNRLGREQQIQVVKALVEGNSLRDAARMTGVARMTVEKLLRDLSKVCMRYQDEHLRNLTCKRNQCNEILSLVYAKQEYVAVNMRSQLGCGDLWTWVAIDADSKLAVSWLVGDRSASSAFSLMDDLASRLAHRIQLTTNGHRVYLDTVESKFGSGVDYSMLVKIYGAGRDKEATHSPAECMGCRTVPIIASPYPKHVSTSSLERQSLTMRISVRRFARLTNTLSKKVENYAKSVAVHFMYHNFVRIQRGSRVTPAIALGITDRVWEVEDMVALLSN